MKALTKCCNGCAEPPQPPSKVLCAKCFAELDGKMRELPAQMARLAEERTHTEEGDHELA